MVKTFRPSRRVPRGRYTPNLWPVWLVAPLMLLIAAALGYLVYQGVEDLLSQAASQESPQATVRVTDVLKTTVTTFTLIGAVLAGLYAYRKQLLSEGDAHRADAGQLAGRYTTAAEQLGHDKAAVRLAGVYALARLADDWEEQRQVCLDVLCAYLRMPYEANPTADGFKEGEREVRESILGVIHDHLRNVDAFTSWSAYNFNFIGATLEYCDLSGCTFTGSVLFSDVTFLSGVQFSRAKFTNGAIFVGATLNYRAVFDYVTFNGMVSFTGATFKGWVSFDQATFNERAAFDRARFKEASFDKATFNGQASFDRATFNDMATSFDGVTFNDRASFDAVTFHDMTSSDVDTPHRGVSLHEATGKSGVSFHDTMFNGEVVWSAPTMRDPRQSN